MTFSDSEKYSKRKLEYEDDSGFASRKLFISLRSSLLILTIIVKNNLTSYIVVQSCWIFKVFLLYKNDFTDKPAATILLDGGVITLGKIQLLLNWLSENCSHLLWPSVKGSLWILFSWTLLYLNSSEPGVNPPASLSPRWTSHHIGYLTSVATGVVIFCLSLSNV